jgi:hypothetical protein
VSRFFRRLLSVVDASYGVLKALLGVLLFRRLGCCSKTWLLFPKKIVLYIWFNTVCVRLCCTLALCTRTHPQIHSSPPQLRARCVITQRSAPILLNQCQ